MSNMYTPFILLLLFLLFSWVTGLKRFRIIPLLLSLVAAYYIAIIHLAAVIPLVLLSITSFLANYRNIHVLPVLKSIPRSIYIFVALIIAFSIGFHVWPGFVSIGIVNNIRLSAESHPYTLSLQFDKAIAGCILFMFFLNPIASRKEWYDTIKISVSGYLVLALSLIPIALLIHFVEWTPKLPHFLAVWIFSNLFITCFTEEIVFRGIIQESIIQWLNKAFSKKYTNIGIVVSALIFGVLHYAGGITFVLLSVYAGLIYGFVYHQTRKIETSMLTHFLFNLSHVLLLSYPFRG